ncbi:chemotaxis protein CheW [Ramlibacter agri]
MSSQSHDGQYLTFQLAGDMYAIGILAIKEIIEYRGLTPVPMMPAFVRGVINLRGAVVPVMDPLARFGRASSVPGKRTCVVIVEIDGGDGEPQSVGMLVDAVSEVLEIGAADIEPPPPFGSRIRTDFIAGMGKVRGKFVILLAAGHVLSLDIEGLAEARAEAAVA